MAGREVHTGKHRTRASDSACRNRSKKMLEELGDKRPKNFFNQRK